MIYIREHITSLSLLGGRYSECAHYKLNIDAPAPRPHVLDIKNVFGIFANEPI